jgi:hypothetical protein
MRRHLRKIRSLINEEREAKLKKSFPRETTSSLAPRHEETTKLALGRNHRRLPRRSLACSARSPALALPGRAACSRRPRSLARASPAQPRRARAHSPAPALLAPVALALPGRSAPPPLSQSRHHASCRQACCSRWPCAPPPRPHHVLTVRAGSVPSQFATPLRSRSAPTRSPAPSHRPRLRPGRAAALTVCVGRARRAGCALRPRRPVGRATTPPPRPRHHARRPRWPRVPQAALPARAVVQAALAICSLPRLR